jgi:hypothetical protein
MSREKELYKDKLVAFQSIFLSSIPSEKGFLKNAASTTTSYSRI